MPDQPSVPTVVQCASWREFAHGRLVDLLHGSAGDLIFRGHADSRWPLESSLVRLIRSERDTFIFDDLEDAATWSVAEFARGMLEAGISPALAGDELAVQALAQHYGMPTSLLDWSLSPYTAAFFAFSEIAREQVDSEQVAIWMLDTRSALVEQVEFPIDQRMGKLVLCKPGIFGNDRLRNQFGCFTLLRSELSSVESYIDRNLSNGDCSPLTKFLVPAGDADEALTELAYMGLNDGQLFPGVEQLGMRSALRLRERVRQRHRA